MSKMQWFRIYHRMVDDEKIRLLAFEDRWHFIAVCCLKADGLLNEPESDIKRRKIALKLGVQLRELDEIQRRLQEVGLVGPNLQPLAWEKRQYQKPNLPRGESLDGFSGYVYFISEEGANEVKIGYSKNPWARIKELQTGRPGKLSVVATVKTTEASERRVQEMFESELVSGEWFSISPRISSLIKEIRSKRIKTDLDIARYVSNYVATGITTTETETDTDTDTERGTTVPLCDGEVESEFDEFVWKEFPKNPTSRRTLARKAYMALARHEQISCMGGVARFALRFEGETCDDRPLDERLKYVPHLSNWIRDKGWIDEETVGGS